jgi:hypothetical protein
VIGQYYPNNQAKISQAISSFEDFQLKCCMFTLT